jgi:hypothetical protein
VHQKKPGASENRTGAVRIVQSQTRDSASVANGHGLEK